MKVLDLFCGAGGLASGFAKAGFEVNGVDINPYVEEIFSSNHIGNAQIADLSKDQQEIENKPVPEDINQVAKTRRREEHVPSLPQNLAAISQEFDLIIGGPPCKPWSTVNLTRREDKHPDYYLFPRFFDYIRHYKPSLFLLENVPPTKKILTTYLEDLEDLGYSVDLQLVRYSDYGASIARRRIIAIGIQGGKAADFFQGLLAYRTGAKTVKDAIGYLSSRQKGEIQDHDYPNFRTIEKYRKYYETGKYGWYKLEWEKAAPSFGNVTKTYILHPSSWNNGTPPRVISVKEALLLMGFDQGFHFPKGMGMGVRYQMVADAVSPVFAYAAACVIKEIFKTQFHCQAAEPTAK